MATIDLTEIPEPTATAVKTNRLECYICSYALWGALFLIMTAILILAS